MLTAMRLSLAGSSGAFGSTKSSRLPLPLVSSTNGVQPCDFTSSPVSSNILRFSHPSTPGPATPALSHSVWSGSEPKLRWWVGKQVLISVNVLVAGSENDTLGPAASSGKTFADGWSEPALQKAGFGLGRTRAVYQTRFFSSSIGLCVSVLLSQIGSSPHQGEGPIALV